MVELWLKETDNYIHTSISRQARHAFQYQVLPVIETRGGYSIPVVFGLETIGMMQFYSDTPGYPNKEITESLPEVAQFLGIASVNQQTQSALRERVKELACVYQMTQISGKQGVSLDEVLQSVVEIIPPAWQYPDITAGRISLDGRIFTTHGFNTGWQKQVSDILVKGKQRGFVEVIYTKTKPKLDEGPFLREERNLIDAIATQIGLIIEQKETEEVRKQLQDQLRHADRLALIGQLAAGVAHELNEPLGSILGFAQLIRKEHDFPEHSIQDIDRIIKASLYAREIIKKLLVFARIMPPAKTLLNINQVVKDVLFFLEYRMSKSGIKSTIELEPHIPDIFGDKSQLTQVLVNIVVNSIQAMPDGGDIRIITKFDDGSVKVVVEDTGIGMDNEVKSKIFLPFFTTKDVNEGTGLGLAVVHGIINSLSGHITVESTMGKGTKFEILLPIAQS